MNALADAAVYALIYINGASGDDDRADEDVKALEWLSFVLRQSSEAEREAIRTAVESARTKWQSYPGQPQEVLDSLRAIEEDILAIDPA
jgi:hypothetical protein